MERICSMVLKPSMPGIMMSINTMSVSACRQSNSMAVWPFSAEITCIRLASSTLVSAKILRTSSSTTRAFLPSRLSAAS
ncbi:hypothetical protein D3C76_1679080 [compost metagenome]